MNRKENVIIICECCDNGTTCKDLKHHNCQKFAFAINSNFMASVTEKKSNNDFSSEPYDFITFINVYCLPVPLHGLHL